MWLILCVCCLKLKCQCEIRILVYNSQLGLKSSSTSFVVFRSCEKSSSNRVDVATRATDHQVV